MGWVWWEVGRSHSGGGGGWWRETVDTTSSLDRTYSSAQSLPNLQPWGSSTVSIILYLISLQQRNGGTYYSILVASTSLFLYFEFSSVRFLNNVPNYSVDIKR